MQRRELESLMISLYLWRVRLYSTKTISDKQLMEIISRHNFYAFKYAYSCGLFEEGKSLLRDALFWKKQSSLVEITIKE